MADWIPVEQGWSLVTRKTEGMHQYQLLPGKKIQNFVEEPYVNDAIKSLQSSINLVAFEEQEINN